MEELMSLTASFNKDYQTNKVNSYVLSISYDVGGYTQVMAYDFMARVMTLRTEGHGDAGVRMTPFNQLDRDSLIDLRDELIRKGGTPPELPPEPHTLNKPARGLNP